MLPLCLEIMEKYKEEHYTWLGNKKLIFTGATYS